jgi:hypothetical protein
MNDDMPSTAPNISVCSMTVKVEPEHWQLSHRADRRALPLADRHYNRQKPGTPQFVPPGRCIVLLTNGADALWVSSWPFAEYVKHEWAGAWLCTMFRNESAILSSTLIREAVAITRGIWTNPPPLGMVTFVDPTKIKHKRDFGRCYRRAGFREVGKTRGGLIALQILPDEMPAPAFVQSNQLELYSLANVA